MRAGMNDPDMPICAPRPASAFRRRHRSRRNLSVPAAVRVFRTMLTWAAAGIQGHQACHATRRVHCPMTFIHSASPATETDKMRSPAAPVLRRLAGDSLLDPQPGARPQPGSGLRSVPAHPANRRRRPSFQISGKGAGFTRTVLGIAAHRYASSEMSDQGKGRQSRLAVPPYFTQAALRRSRCTSDR